MRVVERGLIDELGRRWDQQFGRDEYYLDLSEIELERVDRYVLLDGRIAPEATSADRFRGLLGASEDPALTAFTLDGRLILALDIGND